MAEPLPILPARIEDARAHAVFIELHTGESGKDGGLPHTVGPFLSTDELAALMEERWRKPLTEPGWGRAWLLWSGPPPERGPAGFHQPSARVVGSLQLVGPRSPAELHRAKLGVGMLQPYRGQGHGRRLMEAALAWAREESGLAWVDLGVFVGNDRARRLYESMGFEQEGFRPDAFRMDGVSVDAIHMSLALRR